MRVCKFSISRLAKRWRFKVVCAAHGIDTPTSSDETWQSGVDQNSDEWSKCGL